MLAILQIGEKTVITNEDDAYQFVISISKGEIKFEQIVEWLKTNTSVI